MSSISAYRQDNQRSGTIPQLKLPEKPEVIFHSNLTKKDWRSSGSAFVLANYPRIFAAESGMHYLFTRDVSSGKQATRCFGSEAQEPSTCPLLIWDESVIYCRDYEITGYDKGLHLVKFQKSLEKPQFEPLLTTTPVLFEDTLICAFSIMGESKPLQIVKLSPGGKSTTFPLNLEANDLEVPLVCDSDSLYICGMFELARLSLPLTGSDPLWTFEYPRHSITKPPVASDNLVFLGVEGYDYKLGDYQEQYVLSAVNTEDGNQVWDLPIGGSMSSLCVSEDKVIFHDDETLTSCNPSTGEIYFELGLSPTSWYSDPLLVTNQNKLIMIRNWVSIKDLREGSKLLTYSLEKEKKVNEVDIPGLHYKHLHTDGQFLVAGGTDGDILVLK